jgi:biopolymer transport protein TolQ
MIANFIIASNPFFEAYIQSDIIGKLIFISLVILSICSWTILIQKCWVTYQAKKNSSQFKQTFLSIKQSPLNIECDALNAGINPFRSLYLALKKTSLELLNKNKHFAKAASTAVLSPADIEFVRGHLISTIAYQIQNLEKNLFILATIVSLGPFLGLLGTVWGILTTFSDMTTTHPGGNAHHAVLGGLSLALAATVLGLIDAIPALIGYNYLKNNIRDFETEMDGFAHEILASVEIQYRVSS